MGGPSADDGGDEMGVDGRCGSGVLGVSVLCVSEGGTWLPCSEGDGRPDCSFVMDPRLDSLCPELGGDGFEDTNRVPKTSLFCHVADVSSSPSFAALNQGQRTKHVDADVFIYI